MPRPPPAGPPATMDCAPAPPPPISPPAASLAPRSLSRADDRPLRFPPCPLPPSPLQAGGPHLAVRQGARRRRRTHRGGGARARGRRRRHSCWPRGCAVAHGAARAVLRAAGAAQGRGHHARHEAQLVCPFPSLLRAAATAILVLFRRSRLSRCRTLLIRGGSLAASPCRAPPPTPTPVDAVPRPPPAPLALSSCRSYLALSNETPWVLVRA